VSSPLVPNQALPNVTKRTTPRICVLKIGAKDPSSFFPGNTNPVQATPGRRITVISDADQRCLRCFCVPIACELSLRLRTSSA
jgi:hypothetical protein